MSNYLSLDYGSKKIGVAYKIGADPIVPTESITNTSKKQIMTEIVALCQDKHIDQIVIGLPLNLKGEQGHQAKATIEFKKSLQKNLAIPIALTDERFTSKIYHDTENIDSYSAAAILSNYLSYQQNK